MAIDRRDFFRLAAKAAAFTAVGKASVAEARPQKPMPEEALGLLFDGTLCIGCRACMPACKEANEMEPERNELVANGQVSAVWDAPLDLSGHTLNVIKAYRDGTGLTKDVVKDGYAFTKQSCFHCVDPSCVSACPVSAMTKDPVNGIVSYNVEACIGCRYCVAACPFGVPRFTYDTPKPKISKCQLCKERLEKGEFAACATVCPTGATLFGKVKDLKAEVARRRGLAPDTETVFPRGRIGGNDSYRARVGRYVERVYGEHEIGGTQVLHLSGVPFELLDKPELPDVAPARVSETLQHGLYYGLIAPATFLGILVAAARRNMIAPRSGSARPEGEDIAPKGAQETAGKDPDAPKPPTEGKP